MKNTKIILLLSSALLLAGCGSSAPDVSSSDKPEEKVTVQDGIGRSVTLAPSSVKKVLCVGAGALRYFAYLEPGKGRLCAVEDIDNPAARTASSPFEGVARPYFDANADEYKGLPSCGQGGPMHQSPELEKIVSCAPDLIISDYETQEQATQMEQASGAKVFTVKYGMKGVFDENFSSTLTNLGKVLGKESRSQEIIDYVSTCKADIQTRTKDITDKPLVYVGGVGNWGQKDYLSTHPNYPAFQVANIQNVLSGEGLASPGVQDIEKEKFASIASKIDVMILDSAGMSKTIGDFAADSTIFDGVKAVENGEVYLQLPYNAYYQNIEINLINTYFSAKAVYPSAFEDVDIASKADEILAKFTGKAIYSTLASMKGQYGGYQKISDLKAFLREKAQ